MFVPIISDATNARSEGYFRLEWKLAVDRSHLMADDQVFFVPIIWRDTPEASARVPDAFRTRQWSRLHDDGSITAFAARVAKLVDGSASSGDIAPQPAPVRGPGKASNAVASAPDEVVRVPAATPAAAPATPKRNPRQSAALAAIGIALVFILVVGFMAFDRERKARFVSESLTRMAELSRKEQFTDALLIAQEITRAGGQEKLTATLQDEYSRSVNVTSTPPGAKLELRPYDPQKSDGAWLPIGTAPLDKVRVPRGAMEWRATLPDGASHLLVTAATPNKQIAFAPMHDGIDGSMVPVPEGTIDVGTVIGLQTAQGVKLAAFSIDRLEVRNRDFARFVAAGGYTREAFWQEAFIDGTRTLAFAEAMSRFKDATGRLGPAHWKLGNFAEGEGDLPVRGVSWYEAAAYARFVGKALPTLYHWYYADTGGDDAFLVSALLPSANFSGAGPRVSTNSRNVGAFGAIDMAGNVREWVATRTDKGKHIVVGGSWLEVAYQYKYGTGLSPWERPADVGFRCMKYRGAAVDGIAAAPVREGRVRDGVLPKPVSDTEYAVYARLFERTRAPLDARVEPGASSSPFWTRTKVSYATGYGNARMMAYLYLPKNAKPPYQTVVFMPGSGVFNINKPFEQIGETPAGNWRLPEMIIRGGRAVLYPTWNDSFERFSEFRWTRSFLRERLPQWVSELQRSVEFLHTRSEVDSARIGYYGFSLGAMWAPNMLAMEPRVSAAVLLAGGLEGPLPDGDLLPPELDAATYAPRVKAAVAMINGRSDLRFPLETSQEPLFKLLGSPTGKKIHKTFPGGHSTLGWFDDVTRETHDWFDRQFGPIAPVERALAEHAAAERK